MAYITGSELSSRLPGGGYGLASAEAQGFIDDWISLLAPHAPSGGNAEGVTETALTRAIVSRGAFADALETAMVRAGYIEVPVADKMRKEANLMLARYDASTVSPGEGPVVSADGVKNKVPELWSERELDRRLGSLYPEEYINTYPGSDPWDL